MDKEILAMSAKFYNLTELSSLDFQSFDNLLLEHNPETSFHHLYTLDHLNSSLQDNKPWENLTYKEKLELIKLVDKNEKLLLQG